MAASQLAGRRARQSDGKAGKKRHHGNQQHRPIERWQETKMTEEEALTAASKGGET